MIFIIQDKNEDPIQYIASFTTSLAAEDLLKELEAQDREDGSYEPDKYRIRRAGICWNDYSKECGNCTNSICMLERPEKDCPLVKKKAAMAADGAAQPALMPTT